MPSVVTPDERVCREEVNLKVGMIGRKNIGKRSGWRHPVGGGGHAGQVRVEAGRDLVKARQIGGRRLWKLSSCAVKAAERTGLCWGMERGRRSGWSEGSGFSGGIDGPRQLERGGLGKKYCATIYSCHFHPCLNIYEQGYPHPSPRVDADKVSSWASLLENIRLGRKWQAKYYTGVIIVWWVYWSPGRTL